MWQSRELLRVMVWRDFTLRYKQTVVGASWAVLQPLGLTAVFAIFLGRLVPNPIPGLPYAVFVLPAMVLWQFFSKAVSMSGTSLSVNYDTITKVFFPRLYLPVSTTLGVLVDLAFGLLASIVVMIIYGEGPDAAVVFAPLFILLAIVSALGVGIWFAAFDARFRDLRLALPFVMQLWFFATPVVYSASTIPERYSWVYDLNPMAGAVEGFRWSMLADVPRPSLISLVSPALVAVVVMVTGIRHFRRGEGAIVDIL
jgi:lipopolysaccharide transport system permease protein